MSDKIKNEMNDKIQENKKDARLIAMAEEKLRWYALEASEEEFDGEAVEALVKLLGALEQGTVSQESAQKQREEDAFEELQEYIAFHQKHEGNQEKPGKRNRFFGKTFLRKSLSIAATAACLLIVIMVAGFMGAANAGMGDGIFFWVNRDEKGESAFLNTQQVTIQESETEVVYASVEEVPEEYRQFVTDIQNLEELQDFDFDSFSVISSTHKEEICVCFKSAEETVCLGKMNYQGNAIYMRNDYDEYETMYTGEVNGYTKEVIIKMDESGEEEIYIFFYDDYGKYYVEGKENIDLLEEISDDYMKFVHGE